jgi:predicted dehydrogenase
MPSKLRVAIAGAGFASGLHLAGWKRLAGVEVLGICDPVVTKAAARAREFGIEAVFDDVATMLEAVHPDVIDIVAPLDAHVPLCLLAADRGVHILCQKPLAPSVAQAKDLQQAIAGRVRLMVHENWRFRTHYRQLKTWLDAGALGEPVSCSIHVTSSGLLEDASGLRPQIVRQPFFVDLDRLLIGEALIHHLDVLRWLLGPLDVIAARTGRICPAVRGEDHAVILLDGRNCWAILEGSYVAAGEPPTSSDSLELRGTRGVARLNGGMLSLLGDQQESLAVDLAAGYGDSYAAAIAHFASALAANTPFETDVSDNLRTLELVESAYKMADRQEKR